MADASATVADLRRAMARFVAEREWEPFHSPKNLAMALAVEVGELMEHFLWMDNEDSRAVADDPEELARVGEEVADVTCLLLALCNALNLDLSDTFHDKIEKNARKYPVEKCRGRYRVE